MSPTKTLYFDGFIGFDCAFDLDGFIGFVNTLKGCLNCADFGGLLKKLRVAPNSLGVSALLLGPCLWVLVELRQSPRCNAVDGGVALKADSVPHLPW